MAIQRENRERVEEGGLALAAIHALHAARRRGRIFCVDTLKRLNQQVRRNLERFPGDLLFQLKPEEADSLRMHFATLKKSRGAHRKHAPLVFTEHGAIMTATILSSPRAVQMSVYVVRMLEA